MKNDLPTIERIARACVPELDNILGMPFPCLDKGFVRVVDYMGNDAAVVQMARVSYGEGTKHISEDAGLIKYLMRHDHTSPFEGCEIKLHLKMPIFVARQWIRHRTASVNEYSARYSILRDEFYFPELEEIGYQSEDNKQGTGEQCPEEIGLAFLADLKANSKLSYEDYEAAIKNGVSRELARTMLPVNIYTECYWKIDLHNLLHFLRLRADSHAQREIRVFAEAIIEIVKMWVPQVYEAAQNYRFGAVKLGHNAFGALADLLGELTVDQIKQALLARGVKGGEVKEVLNLLSGGGQR